MVEMVDVDDVADFDGEVPKLSYAVEQRMRLLDFMLKHFGHFNASALCDYFGISEPQAARDVRLYKRLNPYNVLYDPSAKVQRAVVGFKPYFD